MDKIWLFHCDTKELPEDFSFMIVGDADESPSVGVDIKVTKEHENLTRCLKKMSRRESQCVWYQGPVANANSLDTTTETTTTPTDPDITEQATTESWPYGDCYEDYYEDDNEDGDEDEDSQVS